eukprot:scaffold99788_cov22-Tisochrysis_lutea.AAC.1
MSLQSSSAIPTIVFAIADMGNPDLFGMDGLDGPILPRLPSWQLAVSKPVGGDVIGSGTELNTPVGGTLAHYHHHAQPHLQHMLHLQQLQQLQRLQQAQRAQQMQYMNSMAPGMLHMQQQLHMQQLMQMRQLQHAQYMQQMYFMRLHHEASQSCGGGAPPAAFAAAGGIDGVAGTGGVLGSEGPHTSAACTPLQQPVPLQQSLQGLHGSATDAPLQQPLMAPKDLHKTRTRKGVGDICAYECTFLTTVLNSSLKSKAANPHSKPAPTEYLHAATQPQATSLMSLLTGSHTRDGFARDGSNPPTPPQPPVQGSYDKNQE